MPTDSSRPAIYLASPLGFVTYTRPYAAELADLVRQAGAEPLDPWSTGAGAELARLIENGASESEVAIANRRVGEANCSMIERSDAVLACLDGIAVDDGTAAEIGYAVGIGRTVAGFRLDLRITGDNRATAVNLQIAYLIERSGGAIFLTPEAGLAHLLEYLGTIGEQQR